jgi:hypothetical protein
VPDAKAFLAVTDAMNRLCRRWGTETVLHFVKHWVAYMEGQITIMEKHGMRDERG